MSNVDDANAALKFIQDAASVAGLAVVSAKEAAAQIASLSLQVDSLSAANVGLQAQLDALRQENASLKAEIERLKQPAPPPPPPPPPAPTRLDVRTYGAQGNGVADDTLAIQKAIDASKPDLPAYVPAGFYLINSLRVPSGTSSYGLLVGAGKRLECDPNAIFMVKPNSAPRNMCIRVDSGVMVGGQVRGDRDLHTYTAGSTHEWGYGVQLRGNNPQTIGVKVSKCTGDGFGVSGTKPMMRDCLSDGNRRQGLSMFASTGFRAYNCGFINTKGTAPQAGVDLEPDSGEIVDAVFENCWADNNTTSGFMGEVRDEVAGSIQMTLKNCNTSGNANGIRGAGYNGKTFIRVEGGTHVNKSACVRAESGSVITLVGGTYDITDKSTSTAQQYAIQKYGDGQVIQSGVVFK